MNVLIDTCIWATTLRRKSDTLNPYIAEFKELIAEERVVIIGPIRQEILSGIKNELQYHSLRDHLRAFEDLPLTSQDFEKAASLFNRCRSKGIQGSNTDFLMCAVAEHHHLSIFTSDKDFTYFCKHISIRLHQIRK